MSPSGSLELSVSWDGKAVREVAISSTRPLQAMRVIEGRHPRDALRAVPRLFSVCAQAQGAAAARALEAAGGVEAPPEPRLRELSVLAEAMREHLWRLLVALPRALGLPPDGEAVSSFRGFFAPCESLRAWKARLETLAGGLARHVFGRPGAAWLGSERRAEFLGWLNGASTVVAAAMRALWAQRWSAARVAPMPEANLAAVLGDLVPALEREPGFAREPHWRGAVVETGPYPRQRAAPLVAAYEADGNPVFVRMLARLVELAQWSERMGDLARGRQAATWVNGAAVRPGTGVGWTETARGLLVHLIQVNSAQVGRCIVVSPTEWNFHPRGAFARGLVGMQIASRGELRRRASLLACALDPCVAYRLDIRDA